MTKQKKELFTARDRQGIAEKKGIDIGSLLSEKDKKNGLFTEKDRKGLM